MTKLTETFGTSKVFLPVIHAIDVEQVITNTATAKDAGADGVFIINMDKSGLKYKDLQVIQKAAKREFPQFWIGVNFNDLYARGAFQNLNNNIDGLWVDDAEIDEFHEDQFNAQMIAKFRQDSGWEGLYFGGVAFKHQKNVVNPGLVAKRAVGFVDVITTSGERTGVPPTTEKIAMMKKMAEGVPIAISSGISIDNIPSFKSLADCFLVSSSLLVEGTEDLEFNKVRALADAVHQ